MNPLRLGITLGIGWLLLPFLLFAWAIFILGYDAEYTLTENLSLAFLCLPMILGTVRFASIAYSRFRSRQTGKLLLGILVFGPILLTIATAICLNTAPRRISPDTVKAPSGFDPYFSYAPQTAVGFPCPFVRIFDEANPDPQYTMGNIFFDFSSLLGNVTFWMFPMYLWFVIAFLELPKQGEQTSRL